MKPITEYLVNNHVKNTDVLYLGPESDFSNPDALIGKFVKINRVKQNTITILKIKYYKPHVCLKGYYSINLVTDTDFNLCTNNGWSTTDPIIDTYFEILDITDEDKLALDVAEKVYPTLPGIKDDHTHVYIVKMNGTYEQTRW